ETRELLRGFVAPLLEAGCDTLILGCTHYPFHKPLLSELVPASMSLIDTGEAVARQLGRLLDSRELRATGPAAPTRFFTSGDVEALRRALPVLSPHPACLESLPVELGVV